MSERLLDDLDAPWTSTSPALIAAADAAQFVGDGPGSMRLVTRGGTLGAAVQATLAPSVDLSPFDELRFWIRADRAAHGTAAAPFFLELEFADAGDLPGEVHRWLVPVNRAGRWELRRIGIERERRSAVTRLAFRCAADTGFTAHLDRVLVVREELVADAERALLRHLEEACAGFGPAPVALAQAAGAGQDHVTVPSPAPFVPGNAVLLSGGGAAPERHLVAAVAGGPQTTLTFAPGETVAGTFPAGTSTVALFVPAVVDAPAAPAAFPSPSIRVSPLDVREDRERSGHALQRDSFRARGARVVCCVRPAARAWTLDYQLTALAPDRAAQVEIVSRLLARLSPDVPLWIRGAPAPVALLAPPPLQVRDPGEHASLYLRLWTHGETAARREVGFVTHAELEAARIDAPLDQEGIRVDT